MSKFGELISQNIPVLLDFYTDRDQQTPKMNTVLRNVAANVIGKVKVLKIDVDKNPELVKALRIKVVPTLMVYKEGDMVWRESGHLTEENLMIVLKKHFV
ncbi:thioredoxin 1 [Pustulibacterium marinum]|uniref:Thioredoxin 1 n=1 Tax=Pustulibacterium marinum TaxID=1224947 RepID=A0A1I7HAR7_9FLAO|nr:thioredoxin family protein [Pustulibacterium marinum]SFU57804.1 thioredoxin 1 [Pustulibacterium marinum]